MMSPEEQAEKSLNKIHDLKKYPYRMVWKINNTCNYNCAYCLNKFDAAPREVKVRPPEYFKQLFDKTGHNWLFMITGGEPFIYPHFVDICALLQENHFLQITSNMSTGNIYQFADTVDPARVFLISASYHAKEREKMNQTEDFLEKCLYLKEKGFTVLFNYVAHPDVLPRMAEDFKLFNSRGLAGFAVLMRDDIGSKAYPAAYTNEERDLIKKYLLDSKIEWLSASGQLDYYGRYCEAGHKYCVIDEYGDVFRCSTLRKKSGNIFEGTFNLRDKQVPCVAGSCSDGHCGVAAISEKRAFPLFTWCEKRNYKRI